MIRPSKKNAGVIYLDVEIQRTAPEVGGWDNLHKVGVAVAVALSAETNQLHIFTEKEIKKLSPLLQAADCVIGYNIVNFDFKVLNGYRQMSLDHVKCFDLMGSVSVWFLSRLHCQKPPHSYLCGSTESSHSTN